MEVQCTPVIFIIDNIEVCKLRYEFIKCKDNTAFIKCEWTSFSFPIFRNYYSKQKKKIISQLSSCLCNQIRDSGPFREYELYRNVADFHGKGMNFQHARNHHFPSYPTIHNNLRELCFALFITGGFIQAEQSWFCILSTPTQTSWDLQ